MKLYLKFIIIIDVSKRFKRNYNEMKFDCDIDKSNL